MHARVVSTLFAGAVAGVGLFGLADCELLVDLDRGEVDSAVPDGCSLCTSLSEAGEDGGVADGASDAGDATLGDATALDGSSILDATGDEDGAMP